jgi:DNA-binding NtrC family response regulator
VTRRLLIVEDDRSLRRMLVWELSERGYEVAEGEGCATALALAGGRRFDLALVDYDLPDGDGIGLLERLRAMQPGLCVLLCSGMASPDTAALAINKGASAFLHKPLRAESLDRSLRAALEAGRRAP